MTVLESVLLRRIQRTYAFTYEEAQAVLALVLMRQSMPAEGMTLRSGKIVRRA
jgi:hypothetical protein